jgi:3-isopropylmalate dehydratase small subunit
VAEGKGSLLAYVVLTIALSVIIAQAIALIFYSEENSRIKKIEREAGDLADKNRALMEQNAALAVELEALRARRENGKQETPKENPDDKKPPNGAPDDKTPPEGERWK